MDSPFGVATASPHLRREGSQALLVRIPTGYGLLFQITLAIPAQPSGRSVPHARPQRPIYQSGMSVGQLPRLKTVHSQATQMPEIHLKCIEQEAHTCANQRRRALCRESGLVKK